MLGQRAHIEHRNQNLRQISEAKCPRTFKPQTISHPQKRKPLILKPVPLVKVIARNKMIGTLLCTFIRKFWLTDNIWQALVLRKRSRNSRRRLLRLLASRRLQRQIHPLFFLIARPQCFSQELPFAATGVVRTGLRSQGSKRLVAGL